MHDAYKLITDQLLRINVSCLYLVPRHGIYNSAAVARNGNSQPLPKITSVFIDKIVGQLVLNTRTFYSRHCFFQKLHTAISSC